jgi:hypothetical protein
LPIKNRFEEKCAGCTTEYQCIEFGCAKQYANKQRQKLNLIEVTVTMEQTFVLPKHLNGSSPKEIIREWFEVHNINRYHATRDAYAVGGSKKIISIKIKE